MHRGGAPTEQHGVARVRVFFQNSDERPFIDGYNRILYLLLKDKSVE